MLARGDTAGTVIAHHVELQIISEQKWNDLVGAAKAGRPGRSETFLCVRVWQMPSCLSIVA